MNLIEFLSKKVLPTALAFILLFTTNMQALAQAAPQRFTRQYKDPKTLTAVQDNTRVVMPVNLQDIKKKQIDSAVKMQAAYAKQLEEERKTSSDLKTAYKYNEYDKTGYLKAGQWASKRRDGGEKNTGFFGEIVLQGGKHRGKVITEATIIIKRNGKEAEVPLLNPFINNRDLEVLRYGNINERLVKQAELWLSNCEKQNRSPFAIEGEIRKYGQWAYNDLQNMLQVSFADKQRKNAIAARIKKGEKNPYFFGEQYTEWNKIEQEVKKEQETEQRKKAVMAANPLFTEKDAAKQVQITDEEYSSNKNQIDRELMQSLRAKIAQRQKAQPVRVPYAAPSEDLSIAEALSKGIITQQEIEQTHENVVNKYIGKNIQDKFNKYLTYESNHNTANLGVLGSIGKRFNYFWMHIQNNSIIGKASLWLGAGLEGLVTWKDPSKLYQNYYQANQKYLDYYNMGTKFSFVDEIALTTGTFASDAAVFQGLGKAATAVLPQVTTSSALATQIIVPSAKTGLVLASYDGLNSFGNTLGYKDLNDFNAIDWKRISYDSGRGFFSGAVVGQYGRLIGGVNLTPGLMPQPMSLVLKNGARNVALGMSEGAVFSISGTTYDQLNGMWLPKTGSPDYIGGNPNAFAEMTPTVLFKDMIKFYFAIKLPGSVMFDNTPTYKTPKTNGPVTPTRTLQERASDIAASKAKRWAEADLKAARMASRHKADIKISDEPVSYDKNSDWLLTSADGTQQVFRPGANPRTGTLQPILPAENAVTQNVKTFTATIGEGSGGSGGGAAQASSAPAVNAQTATAGRTADIKPLDISVAEQAAAPKNTFADRIKSKLGGLAWRSKVLTMALSVPVGTTAVMTAPLLESAPSAIYAQAPAQANMARTTASSNASASSQYATTADLYTKAPAAKTGAANNGGTNYKINLPLFSAVRDGWDLGGGGGSGSGSFKGLGGDLTPYSRHQLALYDLGLGAKPEWFNKYTPSAIIPTVQQKQNTAATVSAEQTLPAVTSTALPENWQLLEQGRTLENTAEQQLVAEVRQEPAFENTANITDVGQMDPVSSATFFGGMLLAKIKNLSFTDNIATTLRNKTKANKFAKEVFTKKAPLPSQLKAIAASNADDAYRAHAIYLIYRGGFLNHAVKALPESAKILVTSEEGLLRLYEARMFDDALKQVQDVNVPIQNRISKAERAEIERLKEVSNNLNEEVTAAIADWGTGVTLFETPATNKKLITESSRSAKYVEDNVSQGNVHKNYTYYENNIPVYYRDKDGDISNAPRILLSYSQISAFSTFLSKLGLATKKGIKIPRGLVLVLDEEGKFKLVMPRGNLDIVENNPVAKKIVLDGKETNRMAVDAEFTSSDLIEIAALLEKDDNIAFEIDLNRPDSFKIFLAFHALFIGNDAGNTLTGQFKGYAEKAGGNAAVNGMGGVGYLTPFIGGAAMKLINKVGHVRSILTVYGAVLAALAYSSFYVGINGFYSFPQDPAVMDWINLGIPTTLMVLGGSILNTSVSTLLNIYKDPVARTTAHLQYANNKNYSRLGVAAITGLALVSNLGLNWSIVVPAAMGLLAVAGALLFNTRIYDQHKAQNAKNKDTALNGQAKAPELTPEQKAEKAEVDEFVKEASKGFQTTYKQELNQRHEMKDISRRVSKLYASYAASLMIVTQVLKMAADEAVHSDVGQYMALALLTATALPIALTYAYKKVAGKETAIGENLKKYLGPELFFITTLATMFFASDGKGLGMAFTTLCLLTTTMMRVFSTELIKSKKATDDQLSGLSIPLIAAMTTALVFAPATGPWAIGSLAAALLLYAGTAVPGQLDSARMQNFITAVYKEKKENLKNQNLDPKEYKKQDAALKAEEKFMASKGAAKYSYLNGAGIIGILVAVGAAFVLQDLANAGAAAEQMVNNPTWQQVILDKISAVTGHSLEDSSFSFSRLILAYSALVAWWMVKQNWHLTKAGIGLFKKQQINQERIEQGKVTAKDFDINAKNAAIKMSVLDKEIKDINGIVFSNGKSSETKMTEILNKLFAINNRLTAVAEVLGNDALKKSFEQLKFVTSNLGGMVQNNDISKSYHAQYEKLVAALASGTPQYLEEGIYKEPASLSSYEKGLIYMRELEHYADDIASYDVNADAYQKFSNYYTKAVQELTQYAQDNPFDSERVNQQIRKLRRIGGKMSKVDHSKNTIVPEQDVKMLQETIKLFR